MQIVLICAVLIAALWFRHTYIRFIRKGIVECREFIALLEFMKGRVGCYLESADRWADSFKSEILSGCGFLDTLSEKGDLMAAFNSARGKLSLCEEDLRTLGELFSSFGSGYLDGELAGINTALARLRESEKRQSEENKSRCRVVGAICIAAALGIVLLIL